MGWEGEVRIPVHFFQAALAEVGRGRMTGAQAQSAVEIASGQALSAAEVVEATTLLATISGSTTAKLARAKEIDDVLLLAQHRVERYDTPLAVALRLGV